MKCSGQRRRTKRPKNHDLAIFGKQTSVELPMAFSGQRKIHRSNIISREKFIFLGFNHVKNNDSMGHSKKVSVKKGRLHKLFRN
jgi:hypothetical protein